MSENKLKSKDTIDAELKKIKAELAIAKHREAKLRNQIKGMTEKERRHRNIVWGSYFEYPCFFAPLRLLCYDRIRGLLPYPIQHIYNISFL